MQPNSAERAGPQVQPTGAQPYTFSRMHDLGEARRFRVTTPDGQRAYVVSIGSGFGRCSCPGFRKYDRCRHLPAIQRALEREPFADHGDLDIAYGSGPPRRPRFPSFPDESTLALRCACESAINYLHRLRVADLEWRRHEDLREEADNEVIPLLRNAIHRSRQDA